MKCSGARFFLMINMHFLIVMLCITLVVDARPRLQAVSGLQSWVPSWSSLSSGLATLTSYLPSLGVSPSLGFLQSPAFADLGVYLSDTVPAFGDVYASIPSWNQWQGMLPNVPRPSAVFGQLPNELQSGVQHLWSQVNPLDVERFRRRQYRRGVIAMLGLAGYYNSYQLMYKQYRKGMAAYIEPSQRKRKIRHMKRVCYYELPQKNVADSLEPSKIKSGLCTHIIVLHAKASEYGDVVLPMDQDDDGRLEQMMRDLKNAAPTILLCVSGTSRNAYPALTEVKARRLKFIRSSMNIVRRYGLAGIDLDWDFPDSGDPQDVDNMATLVEELRYYMEPWLESEKKEDTKKFLLTATVSAMPQIIARSYDVKRLSKHLDWVNVMAYDYGLKGDNFNELEHNAPLFGYSKKSSRLNVASSVTMWSHEGMPHEKLVIGLPLYGRNYLAEHNFLNNLSKDILTRDTRQSIADGEQLKSSTIPNYIVNPPVPFELYNNNVLHKTPSRGIFNIDFLTTPIPNSNMLTNTINNTFQPSSEVVLISELNDQLLSSNPSTTKNRLMIKNSQLTDLQQVDVVSRDSGMAGPVIPYGTICTMVSDGSLHVKMDLAAQAPVATDGRNWISFDNKISATLKSRFVDDMGFAGVALYNLNMDDWRGNCDPNKTPFPILRAVWKMLG